MRLALRPFLQTALTRGRELKFPLDEAYRLGNHDRPHARARIEIIRLRMALNASCDRPHARARIEMAKHLPGLAGQFDRPHARARIEIQKSGEIGATTTTALTRGRELKYYGCFPASDASRPPSREGEN